MTSPHSLEDRLRAHFADRTATEPLPGPDTETALADVLAWTADSDSPSSQRPRGTATDIRQQPLWFAAAAVLLVVAVAAAVVVSQRDDPSISTDGPDDDPVTTTLPDRPSSTTTSTTTTTSTSSTTTAPSAGSPLPDGNTLVVGPYGPLGGWDGDSWVEARDWRTTGAAGGEEYKIVGLVEAVTTQVGHMEDLCELGLDEEAPAVEFPPVTSDFDVGNIAVTGVDDPQPRRAEELDPSGATYRDAAREVLADLGLDEADPNVVQVVRADLDGDGSDEVVVVAERITDSLLGPPPGDYSIVFLRQVVDGAIKTTVIEGHVTEAGTQSIDRFRIDAVADVNGDDRMEIVVHYDYYEGAGQRVFELQTDGTVTAALVGGCGA